LSFGGPFTVHGYTSSQAARTVLVENKEPAVHHLSWESDFPSYDRERDEI